jgi:hypothetical protein
MFEPSFLSIYNRVHLETSCHRDRQRDTFHSDPKLLNSRTKNCSRNITFPQLLNIFVEFHYNVHNSPPMDTILSQLTHLYPPTYG